MTMSAAALIRIAVRDLPTKVYPILVSLCGMVVLFLALFSGPVLAQNNADHNGLNDLMVSWKTDCAPRGCLMQTEVLRGVSGSPANPKDFREYVGVNVALARNTRRPEYIAFYVDPRATQGQGIFVAFAKATNDGGSWKMALDDDGAIKIPFTSCGKLGCMAHIPAGLEVEPSTKKRIDLLSKFLNSDAVLVLYTRGKNAYRTMILLTSFQRDYQHVMAVDLAPAQTPQAP
jgi:hypothetical protein